MGSRTAWGGSRRWPPSRRGGTNSLRRSGCSLSWQTRIAVLFHGNNRGIGICRSSKRSLLWNSNCWSLKGRMIVDGLLKGNSSVIWEGERVQSSNSCESLLNRSFWGKSQPGFWSIASCTPSAWAECHNLSDLLLKVYPEWISPCRFNARASELKRNNYQLNTQLKTIDAAK